MEYSDGLSMDDADAQKSAKDERESSQWWLRLSEGVREPDYSSRRVLVADDEEIVGDMVMRTITSRVGCVTERVLSGDAAMERMAQEHFDILIADMMMPGLHGAELVAEVCRRFPDTDIIVMTGFSDSFPYVDVINAGASDFVEKPHMPAEMEAKLVRVFKERDLRIARMQSEEKYRSLFELSMNGMAVMEADSCRFLEANKAFRELTALDEETLRHKTFYDLLDPFERGRVQTALKICSNSGKGTIGGVAVQGQDETELHLDVSVTFVCTLGHDTILLAVRDITEKRRIEMELQHAAQTDELTGLSNKRSFSTRLEGAMGRARREETHLLLLFMDLDNFKACNDKHGHQVGDEVLRGLGKLIRKSIRISSDEGFRYGGDEFAILMSGAPMHVGQRVGERLRDEYGAGDVYGTSLSIGIAELRLDMHAQAFVKAADQALYQAKSAGKNTICVAS